MINNFMFDITYRKVFSFVIIFLFSMIVCGAYKNPQNTVIKKPWGSGISKKGASDLNPGVFFGAKMEPPPGKIFHGAQAEVRPLGFFARHVDWEGISAYTQTTGFRPKLIMHYITFDPLGFWLLKGTIAEITATTYNYIPQIGLDFYTYTLGFDILNPNDITQGIAEGMYDEKIWELARLFNEMATPVFLRPGYEFGGRGQGRHASKQYWVGAWKRIHDIFREAGADQTVFVWNTLDATDYMGYYPGDAYVDWWAVNVFINDADQDEFLNGFIQEAARHNKPVMIAESTPRYVGSQSSRDAWEKWFQPYFNLIFKYPHIKAFCYINASWKGYPDSSFRYDCRIQTDTSIAEKYKMMMYDMKFIHGQSNE